MNWKLVTFLVAFAVVLMVPTTALADACPGAGDEFCLQNNNVGLPTGSIVIHIDITGSTVTVTAHSSVFTDLNIKGFFMNNTSGGNLLPGSNPPATWDPKSNCPCNGDGFGKFTSGAIANGNQGDTVTFTLSGPPTISPNDHGANFAVHVSYTDQQGQSCSLWVSDGSQSTTNLNSNLSFNKKRSTSLVRLSRLNATTLDTPSDSGWGGTTEIPEPSSLALMGVGMFATVGYLRRRLNLG